MCHQWGWFGSLVPNAYLTQHRPGLGGTFRDFSGPLRVIPNLTPGRIAQNVRLESLTYENAPDTQGIFAENACPVFRCIEVEHGVDEFQLPVHRQLPAPAAGNLFPRSAFARQTPRKQP